MPFTRLSPLACLGLAVALMSGTATGQTVNPARAHVQAFQDMHRARLGLPAAMPSPADFSTQVVGGNTAPPGAYPAMVALLFAQVGDTPQAFYCGGTLISSRHVLTAAHCADFLSAADIQVLVGSQSLAAGGTRIAVSAAAIHPQWDPNLVVNDVAVLTLAQPVTGIKPVLLAATERAEDIVAAVGAPARITGWGQTSQTGPVTTELKEAAMVIEGQACNGPTVNCAGSPGHAQAVCFGDSGGPLFSEVLVRGRRVQVGISSFIVDSCGSLGVPDFFARLAVLGPWVKAQIGR